jgi:hypothetical protein
MAKNMLIASAQTRLDDARRKVKQAVIDFSIADEDILEMRNEARRAYDDLRTVELRAKKGFFSFLGL